ncbi:MAG: oxygen-independent coproporphyrinogen III oxidase [Halothiobacillaceae bacterium]|nr:oxygen-independent coproporphyrinogen III oxidase [Halothiobacillaceae bacterium]
MKQSLIFDADLIRRHDKAGPRYTSYPTAVQFHDGFGEADYRAQAQASNAAGGPLSLYFHIPFCDTVCYYCACNKVVTKDRNKAAPYLADLYREIELQASLFTPGRSVDQLHWGGGTPTFLSLEQMRELMAVTGRYFALRHDDRGEYSIEIDPREADARTVHVLRELGFNRMSLGVQDFDPQVQQAVNRIQSEAETFAVLDAARAEGFHGISIDLIYGLPHQTSARFLRTLDRVIEAAPDRLSIFNYAHLPERFKPQRRIPTEALPSAAEKLDILQHTIEHLTGAGYVLIGMDHFARPDDPLAVAQREGSLHRNFQGYSTHADCDLIGLGVSSIGQVHDCFSQNVKDVERYHALLAEGRLPIERGLVVNEDDKRRRALITDLICHFELDGDAFGAAHGIDFAAYFAPELERLREYVADGLLVLDGHRIEVQPIGRLLIRNICATFDRYLAGQNAQRFSKVI